MGVDLQQWVVEQLRLRKGEWRAIAAAVDGVTMIGTGDMGIANTTPATALLAAYLRCPVEDLTGRGTFY
jgi:nicotinate-nucleotide--dimethylbenzimidazole phosphoribosyltransferase